MKAFPLNFFLSVFLISMSHTPAYAESRLEELALWKYKIPTKKPKTVSSGSSYYYLRFFAADGDRTAGLFIPAARGRHHIWLDTGMIIGGSSIGYRYVLKDSYLNERWFAGGYRSWDWYGHFSSSNNRGESFYRSATGIELGGSKTGQFTLNFYGFDEKDQKALFRMSYGTNSIFNAMQKTPQFLPLAFIDTNGWSLKWASTPFSFNSWNMQLSFRFARSNIKIKRSMQERFSSETVRVSHVGGSFKHALFSWGYIEWKIFSGKVNNSVWSKPWFGWTLGVGDIKRHWGSDIFQGRLKEPVQRYIPYNLSFFENQTNTSRFTRNFSTPPVNSSHSRRERPPSSPPTYAEAVGFRRQTLSSQDPS